MSKKKTILLAVCAILVVLLNVVILTHKAPKDGAGGTSDEGSVGSYRSD